MVITPRTGSTHTMFFLSIPSFKNHSAPTPYNPSNERHAWSNLILFTLTTTPLFSLPIPYSHSLIWTPIVEPRNPAIHWSRKSAEFEFAPNFGNWSNKQKYCFGFHWRCKGWLVLSLLIPFILGGNQREVDRLRAEARHSKKGTGERKEGNPIARNEKWVYQGFLNCSDAARLAAKIAAKKAREEAEAKGEVPAKKKGKWVVEFEWNAGSKTILWFFCFLHTVFVMSVSFLVFQKGLRSIGTVYGQRTTHHLLLVCFQFLC